MVKRAEVEIVMDLSRQKKKKKKKKKKKISASSIEDLRTSIFILNLDEC